MNTKTLLLFVAASAIFSSFVLNAKRDPAAGFGTESLRLELDPVTGDDRNLGVQHLGNEIFTTNRNFDLQDWIGSDDGVTAFGGFDGDWLTLDFTFTPDTFIEKAKVPTCTAGTDPCYPPQ